MNEEGRKKKQAGTNSKRPQKNRVVVHSSVEFDLRFKEKKKKMLRF